jgi:hypothetical protein
MTLTWHFETVVAIWPQALVGGLVMTGSALAGWRAARRRTRWTVRLIDWWLNQIVRPLLLVRTWRRRTAAIALNNTSICAGLVALGALGPVVWAAIVGVGFALGIALRIMVESPANALFAESARSRAGRWIAGSGFALNLLEPPAVMISAGLGLGQRAWAAGLDFGTAWIVFAVVAWPMLLAAAAGEALWMGVLVQRPSCEADRAAES